MSQRYEVISYSGTNYRLGAGWTRYVSPHLHREFEFGIVLGDANIFRSANVENEVRTGEMWLFNPFEVHEALAAQKQTRCEYVELQLSPAFFRDYYPDIGKIRFLEKHLTEQTFGAETFDAIRIMLLEAALAFFNQEEYYQLNCASRINRIFQTLLEHVPYQMMDKTQEEAAARRNWRMQRINTLIEEHYDNKLLLNDIAQEEGVSMYYLSHFFRQNWNMSFQEYLLHFRCGKARELLLDSDMSIADISLVCGFSDPKYMRQGFHRLYGTEPSALRRNGADPGMPLRETVWRADEYVYGKEEAVRCLTNALEKLI